MFARLVEAKAKPGKRDEITGILTNDLLPVVKKQRGFVDLVGLASDTDPNGGGGLSLWEDKSEAERFYQSDEYASIMERVNPLVEEMKVHTFNVTISTFHKIAAARGA